MTCTSYVYCIPARRVYVQPLQMPWKYYGLKDEHCYRIGPVEAYPYLL